MTAARLSPDVGRLARCAVVFEPADPPRAGTVAFWDKGFGQPPDGVGRAGGLTVVTQDDGGVTTREVPAVRFAVGDALALLSRARTVDGAHPASVFWGAATVVALQLVARGRMLPGVSPGDHDAWRAGPLDADDVDRLRGLAASMPPEARAVPVRGTDPVEVSDAEALVRAYLDAVADGMPRSAAAAAAAGSPVFAAPEPQHVPGLRGWAQEVAAGLDAGVRVSLRLEMADDDPDVPGVTAVVGVHSLADPTLVVDAADLPHDLPAFGPRPRIDTMLAVRRAARVWPPLIRLLEGTVPDRVELSDSEVGDLLDGGAARLIAAGVDVHWPRTLARSLTTRAVVGAGSPPSDLRSVLGSDDAWMRLDWQVALGGDPLTEAEMEALAEAHRPVVRLRDRWVLVDPAVARRARERRLGPLTPIAALGAALSGTVDVAGTPVEVATSGWLEALRARITDDDGDDDVAPPAALDATLREYQVRGMRWLARMTSLGLGGCLADDMGLGKTITLIALHLHRQADPSSTGPTLVVCPASLLGNWEREVERFAPGTGVGRFHGTGRSIDDVLADVGDGFVLTTYGTMRRDAALLATRTWGLVVADEAQHVKNPMSGTAKALRRIGSVARVALTGTPVEQPVRAVGDPRLDHTRPARHPAGLPCALGDPDRGE